MNKIKKFVLPLATALIFSTGYAQKNGSSSEKAAVISVMKAYNDAIQNLTTDGTLDLFSENSQVFESGGVEGTFAHYVEHHLAPELAEFKSFDFSDYVIETEIDLPYAFTTETYIYTIVLKPDEKGESRTVNVKGVATSILKKMDGTWKIIKTHTSSRKL